MKVLRYEQSLDNVNDGLFLAGPTVRGNQPHLTSWRPECIALLEKYGFDGSVIVPEFTSSTESDKGKEWIPLWEYKGLQLAKVILFWIPRTRELIGLTTNFELGYWIARDRNKMIYGRPDDAYRMSYLDIMWKADALRWRNGLLEPSYPVNSSPAIYKTLEDTVKASIDLYRNK